MDLFKKESSLGISDFTSIHLSSVFPDLGVYWIKPSCFWNKETFFFKSQEFLVKVNEGTDMFELNFKFR